VLRLGGRQTGTAVQVELQRVEIRARYWTFLYRSSIFLHGTTEQRELFRGRSTTYGRDLLGTVGRFLGEVGLRVIFLGPFVTPAT
jgi:hypothetical protein